MKNLLKPIVVLTVRTIKKLPIHTSDKWLAFSTNTYYPCYILIHLKISTSNVIDQVKALKPTEKLTIYFFKKAYQRTSNIGRFSSPILELAYEPFNFNYKLNYLNYEKSYFKS